MKKDMANYIIVWMYLYYLQAGEGFGIPTLEAMSCGVPICVTNYTTGYEVINVMTP